jgi:hypothetical protein
VEDRIRTDDPFGPAASRATAGEPGAIALEPLHGIVQGLASVALGMVFTIAGAPTMALIWLLFDGHFRGFSRLDIVLVAICGFIGCLIVVTSAVFGLIFGITAILAARRQNRPMALGVAGVFLCGYDLLMWIFIIILWACAVGNRI